MEYKDVFDMLEEEKKPTIKFDLAYEEHGFLFDHPNTCSHTGGTPFLKHEEEIPVCEVCQTTMPFLFQLRTPMPKSEHDIQLEVVYHCFRCGDTTVKTYINPDLQEARERYPKSVLPFLAFRFDVPSWSVPDFASFQRLAAHKYRKKVKEEDEDLYEMAKVEIVGTYYLEKSFYKGYPDFIKDPTEPICRYCMQKMNFWIQIDSYEEFQVSWGTLGCLYLFKCDCEKAYYQSIIQSF